eukprot:CAMPEP_0206137050 /NCGR_PEP_ID=MMETSP1473-20131121/2232_1 /ASSEMBLY_ACC=CAM_ASM_001109 /TAXON_ID=1461547 /ORGANISM="Stichococcus sp, Strain RCC1054" /LENGTH=656 /DNA_ID=CAMNT_0053529945 /DNA_START=535 /DNA_END=2505 /DNA_ORIENTATION=-
MGDGHALGSRGGIPIRRLHLAAFFAAIVILTLAWNRSHHGRAPAWQATQLLDHKGAAQSGGLDSGKSSGGGGGGGGREVGSGSDAASAEQQMGGSASWVEHQREELSAPEEASLQEASLESSSSREGTDTEDGGQSNSGGGSGGAGIVVSEDDISGDDVSEDDVSEDDGGGAISGTEGGDGEGSGASQRRSSKAAPATGKTAPKGADSNTVAEAPDEDVSPDKLTDSSEDEAQDQPGTDAEGSGLAKAGGGRTTTHSVRDTAQKGENNEDRGDSNSKHSSSSSSSSRSSSGSGDDTGDDAGSTDGGGSSSSSSGADPGSEERSHTSSGGGRVKAGTKRSGKRKSRGPIQMSLLRAVEAAADGNGAVMLAVTNKDGALFQLPQLLASMKLVPQEDVSAYLVVVAYSQPAQEACLRLHKYCVLDDFSTGGFGGVGSGGGEGVDGMAEWGSAQFKQMTWRKMQLTQDVLLQGLSVLSIDLDIVLFKNPLDGKFNPWMNRELDLWTAIDNGKMLNCGFWFARPTEKTDVFMREWLGRFQVEDPGDIWEQAEFNQILKGAHATMPDLRWEPMDEAWFVDLCFYLEARALLPDQRQFGRQFVATSDEKDNWHQMFGFHAACCKGDGKDGLPECKRSTATALMRWQMKLSPSEWPATTPHREL